MERRRSRLCRSIKLMFHATYTEKNGEIYQVDESKTESMHMLGVQAPRRNGDTAQPGLNKIDIKRNQTKNLTLCVCCRLMAFCTSLSSLVASKKSSSSSESSSSRSAKGKLRLVGLVASESSDSPVHTDTDHQNSSLSSKVHNLLFVPNTSNAAHTLLFCR